MYLHQTIETELTEIEEGLCDTVAREEIFNEVVGDDKYSYAKTYGLGVKITRSNSKICALQEEKAKRVKVEQEYQQSQEKVQTLEKKVGDITHLMKLFLKHQVFLFCSNFAYFSGNDLFFLEKMQSLKCIVNHLDSL